MTRRERILNRLLDYIGSQEMYNATFDEECAHIRKSLFEVKEKTDLTIDGLNKIKQYIKDKVRKSFEVDWGISDRRSDRLFSETIVELQIIESMIDDILDKEISMREEQLSMDDVLFAEEQIPADTDLTKDFYNELPGMVCVILDELKDDYGKEEWFPEAWHEYRQHVLSATMDAMKMPWAIFRKYVERDTTSYENVTLEQCDGMRYSYDVICDGDSKHIKPEVILEEPAKEED